MLSQGSRAVVDTWAQGRMMAKVRTKVVGNLRRSRPHWQPGGGRYLGRGCLHLPTWARPPRQPGCAAWGAFRRLPCEPLRSRISVSHLVTSQFAFCFLSAILSLIATIVNSICENNAICNEIVIASCIGSGYNDCRLQ